MSKLTKEQSAFKKEQGMWKHMEIFSYDFVSDEVVPKKRETVVDLVPEGLRRKNLFPVGRLDKDTTGLLIITDDGNVHISTENLANCNEELLKLQNTEIEINAEKIPVDWLEEITLTILPLSNLPSLAKSIIA